MCCALRFRIGCVFVFLHSFSFASGIDVWLRWRIRTSSHMARAPLGRESILCGHCRIALLFVRKPHGLIYIDIITVMVFDWRSDHTDVDP